MFRMRRGICNEPVLLLLMMMMMAILLVNYLQIDGLTDCRMKLFCYGLSMVGEEKGEEDGRKGGARSGIEEVKRKVGQDIVEAYMERKREMGEERRDGGLSEGMT